MAYVVDSAITYVGVVTSGSLPMPSHKAGDLLFVFAQQDGGTGTFSIGAGWTNAFPQSQAAANGQRTYGWYKLAASDSEPNVTVTSTLSEDLVLCAVSVRGVNQTTPINASSIAGAATSMNMAAPSITTTANNCLLLYGHGNDHSSASLYGDYKDFVRIQHINYGSGAFQVAYKNQKTAGVRPDVRFANGGAVGGQIFCIAINDDGSGGIRAGIDSISGRIRIGGTFGEDRGDGTGDTYTAPSTLAAFIDGIPTGTSVLSTVNAMTSEGVNFNGDVSSDPNGRFLGGILNFAAPVDMSNGVLRMRLSVFNLRDQYWTSGHQYLLVFADGNGNYKGFNFDLRYFGPQAAGTRVIAIDIDNFPPKVSSGTLNTAAITRVGLLMRKVGIVSGDTGTIQWSEMTMIRQGSIAFDGPYNQSEFGLGGDLDALLDSFASHDAAASIGTGLGVLFGGVQFGNNAGTTKLQLAGSAIECQAPYSFSTVRRGYQVTDYSTAPFSVKAAAGDIVDLSSAILSTLAKNRFVIDSATSPSATIRTSGLVLRGFEIINNVAGVTLSEVTFVGCHTATLNGGSLSECRFTGAAQGPCVKTNAPNNIVDCEFVQGASGGHAIEITQPGTYSFIGNTFTGYGPNGSTDAAIYNNSGGAVTLNVSGGGDTPTVRNAAGASTTINNNVQITLENVVVGSSIRVELVSDGSLVEFRVANATTEAFSVSGGANYRVKVRKASSAPRYKPYETQTGALSGNATIFVSQIPDE